MQGLRRCVLQTMSSALSVLALITLTALPTIAQVPVPQTVALGSDYFQTLPGTFAILPGIGKVNFLGDPIGPGNTDTIVQRQADADITGGAATIPIEIVALSLKSAAPVNIGGSFFDVFVTLDPDPNHNKGTMTINGTNGPGGTIDSSLGGTFTSSFDVFFNAELKQVGNPSNTQTMTGLDLGIISTPQPAEWGPTPPPDAVLVKGPFGDQDANLHTDLPKGEVDFFLIGNGDEDKPNGAATHKFKQATPEPSTLSLCMSGLLVFGIWRRTARRRG